MSHKVSDMELLENLKELMVKLGRAPKKEDLRLEKGSKYSENAYKRAFGGVGKALILAGLKPNQVKGATKENIIEDVKNIYAKLGRVFTIKEYQELSMYAYSFPTIKKIFTDWNEVINLAILESEKNNEPQNK